MDNILSIFNNIIMDKNKELLEKIAIIVRTERFKQKLSQEDLAILTGLSVNFISNVENAKQDIRICNASAIAKALGKDLKDFF
jgi:transcriptional regulator with XRE-family HTH domain